MVISKSKYSGVYHLIQVPKQAHTIWWIYFHILFHLKIKWPYLKAGKCYDTVEYLNYQDTETKVIIFHCIFLFITEEVALLCRGLNIPICIKEDFCHIKNMHLGHTWNFLIYTELESLPLMEHILSNLSAHHSSQTQCPCYAAVTPFICQLFCNLRLILLKYREQTLYLK